MRVLLIPLLLVFLLVAGPGACGNKGPLTLPDEDEEIKKQE
ncbi:MAG: lipopeptide [Proteobacteria bacterium]|nr:lipopeptide [Pseudomonadota bacterium]